MNLRALASLFGLVACLWAASAAVAGERVTIRVGHFPNVTHAQALIGHADGWFARALGPDVAIDWKIFNAGPAAIQALFAGEIDLAYLGTGPAIVAYVKSKGRALRVVSGASDGGAALIVRPGSGIRTPADFRGKRVATPQLGNTQDVALRGWLADHGMVPMERGGDVRVMPMANPDQLTMLRLGEIDAAWSPEPWASRLVHQDGGQVFLDEREVWKPLTGGRFATTLLTAHPDFMAAHPELVAAWIAAHQALTAWIADHSEAAKAAVNAELARETGKPLPEDVLDDAWARVTFTTDPITASIEHVAQWAFEQGFLGRRRPDLARLVDLTWLRPSEPRPVGAP